MPFGPRISVSASTAELTISSKLTAFNTGVAPSAHAAVHHHGKRASEPTSINVVLKFSKLIKNEIAAEPVSAGFRCGRVIVHICRASDRHPS